MAATVRLQPPEPFPFHKPDEWGRWKRRFEQFRIASGLSSASEEQQVCTLLYCMGEDTEDVLQSTNATAEDRATYRGVCAKLDAFFRVRRNIIYERARFNRRVQQEEESAEQYIVSLYKLAETCEYGPM